MKSRTKCSLRLSYCSLIILHIYGDSNLLPTISIRQLSTDANKEDNSHTNCTDE